jgi:hypothetical protein
MSLYAVKVPVGSGGRTLVNGADMMVVAAASEADAKAAAGAKYQQDSAWSDATVTELVDTTTVSSETALIGYEFNVAVSGVGDVTVTGVADTLDTLDEIGAALATALNGLDDIGNAAYNSTSQVLTVASGGGGDDLGDKTVTVTVKAPGGDNDDLSSVFVDSITHEGVAGDALSVTFKADSLVLPQVLEVAKQA